MRQRFLEACWNTYIRVSLPWKNARGDRYWAKRQIDDPHGAHQYMALQGSSHLLLDEVTRYLPSTASPVLDLGCNVGRHLNALHARGYTNLYGVDVQLAAIEHMHRIFSSMWAEAHISHATFQKYLPAFPDKFFAVVFTHGATLELVPPSFPVCQHMARVASRAVVLVIHERGHTYPRLWETEFLRAGFVLTKLLRPVLEGDTNSLLVFQPQHGTTSQ